MAVEVDKVLVTLEAKVDDYNRKIDGAAVNFDRRMGQIEKSSSRMGVGLSSAFSLAKGALVGFVASLGVGALISVTKAGLEYAGSLGELAQSLGVSTKLLQEFRFAATQNGASLEGADNALGKFSVTLGNAFNGKKQGVESVNAALAGTGKTLADLAKLSDTDRFQTIADGIARIKDPAQQAAVAMGVFGRGFREILPLLAQGGAGFRQAAAEAAKFGLILSDGQIQQADEVADKIDKLKQALQVKVAGVVADNARAIGQLANALADLAGWAIKAGQQFIGFANIVKSRGFAAALATTNGNDLAAAATPAGARIEAARGMISTDRRLKSLRATASRFGATIDPETEKQAVAEAERAKANYRAARAAERAVNAPVADNPTAGGNATVTPVKGAATPKATGKTEAEKLRQFTDDYEQARADAVSALADLTNTIEARVEAEVGQLDVEREARKRAIDADKDLTAAQKQAEKVELDSVTNSRILLVQRRAQQEAADQVLRAVQESLGSELDLLRLQDGLARTASARRDIELRILDLTYQREKAELEAVVASKIATDADKEIARRKLASLGDRQSAERQNVIQSTAGPGESYLKSFPQDAAEMNEALESIAVNGLRSLNDGIVDAITGAKSLGDAFKGVANSIISDLIRIAVQQAIIKPLGEALFGAGSTGIGGGIGGLFKGLFGRASGGHVGAGTLVRINENGTEGWRPDGSGTVVPIGQMPNAASSGGSTIIQSFTLDARGGVVTEDLLRYVNQVSARAAQAGAAGGAALAQRALGRSQRKRLA